MPDYLRKPPAAADPGAVPALRVMDESGVLRWQVPVGLWSHPREDLGGFRYAVGIAPDRPLLVKGPLVFVGYGLTREAWDDYQGKRIDGSIAVMFTGTPQVEAGADRSDPGEFEAWSDLIREKVENAHAHGAVGVWIERNPLAPSGAGGTFFRPDRTASLWGGVVRDALPLPVFGTGADTLGVIVGLSSDLLGGHRTPGEDALVGLLSQAESDRCGLGPVPLALAGELTWDGGQLLKWEGARATVWYQPDSPAAREIGAVGTECERALGAVESLLSAQVEERVTVLLFADWRSKLYGTRTLGWGSAGDGRMAIVYEGGGADREIVLHELCHIVAGAMLAGNDPPACFNEGLAELVGKTRGDLHSVQAGPVTSDEVTAANLREAKLWTLQELLLLPNIGPSGTNPPVAYPEAASFCAYLMRRIGFDGFRRLSQTAPAGEPTQVVEALTRATGLELDQLEADWHAHLRALDH
jgi:hypothetical protein